MKGHVTDNNKNNNTTIVTFLINTIGDVTILCNLITTKGFLARKTIVLEALNAKYTRLINGMKKLSWKPLN